MSTKCASFYCSFQPKFLTDNFNALTF